MYFLFLKIKVGGIKTNSKEMSIGCGPGNPKIKNQIVARNFDTMYECQQNCPELFIECIKKWFGASCLGFGGQGSGM